MNELNLTPNLNPSPKAVAVAGGDKGLAATSAMNGTTEVARPVEPTPKVDTPKLEQAVARIQEYVQQSERKLDFRLDDNSGQTVIRVYDKQSEELIRQIPGELALKIAEHLADDEPSLLFRAQV